MQHLGVRVDGKKRGGGRKVYGGGTTNILDGSAYTLHRCPCPGCGIFDLGEGVRRRSDDDSKKDEDQKTNVEEDLVYGRER